MLETLGLEQLRTSSPWTDGTPGFVGVPARKVFEAVGARGNTVVASALNDYRAEIPISDFQRYPVLFALRMNGKELAGDSGPSLPTGSFSRVADRSGQCAMGLAARQSDRVMSVPAAGQGAHLHPLNSLR